MVTEEIRQAALDRLGGTEQVFRRTSWLNDRVIWRSDRSAPLTFLQRQARSADVSS